MWRLLPRVDAVLLETLNSCAKAMSLTGFTDKSDAGLYPSEILTPVHTQQVTNGIAEARQSGVFDRAFIEAQHARSVVKLDAPRGRVDEDHQLRSAFK